MILTSALICLALNVYHEARDQSTAGQVAVAQVVINRTNDDRYPSTVCEVVQQGPVYKNTDLPVRHKCQFSWYCDGKKDNPKNSKALTKALAVASTVLDGNTIDIIDGATHYHAVYVKPDWIKTKIRTVRIDNHIFYRWEGKEVYQEYIPPPLPRPKELFEEINNDPSEIHRPYGFR